MDSNPALQTRGLLLEVTECARHSIALAKDCIAAKLREAPITDEPSPVRLLQLAVNRSGLKDQSRVEVTVEERLWTVRGEIALIGECVQMLVARADRISPSDGKVRVTASNREWVEPIPLSHSTLPAGRYVEFAISNGGPPLSASAMSGILDFETAYSLGAGVELSLASSVLDYFGGALSIDSSNATGTTVRLFIPEARETPLTPRMASPFAANKPRSGKVLVVDDEEKIRVLLRRMLSHLNAEVALAEDGAEGVALYKAALDAGDPFDLVILDLTIPGGMGGREAIEEMVKLNADVKGIVSSGYSQDPVMANYKEHRFCAVMAKPYTFAQLKETVSPFLPGLK